MKQTPAARIPGWRGPFYPPAVETLARTLAFWPQRIPDGQALLTVALSSIPGLTSARPMQSTDGYWWLRGAVFDNGRPVLVALPWVRDGLAADRSPAVFCGGAASVEDAAAATVRVARALRRQFATRLPDWYGPYFAPLTLAFHRLWQGFRSSGCVSEAMQNVPGFGGVRDVCTADGYKWHTGVVLMTQHGQALVALPQTSDNRLPLVYAATPLTAESCNALIARVARALLSHQAASNVGA